MKHYIGTKEVLAKKMTKQEYCKHRGWELPSNEDPSEVGMLVEYVGSSHSNHELHEGYISWTPLDAFKSYKENGKLSLSDAVEFGLKKGKMIKRTAWDKDKFVFMQVPSLISVENVVPKMQSLPQSVKDVFINRSLPNLHYNNQIALVYPDNRITAWNTSTDDILINDYEIL